MTEVDGQMMDIANNVLARWDAMRQAAGAEGRSAADKEFRRWLLDTVPSQMAGSPDVDETLSSVTFAAVDRCEELERFADGLLLTRWMAKRYAPRGDANAWRVVMAATDACAVAADVPRHRDEAADTLRCLIAATPKRPGTAMAQAVSRARRTVCWIEMTGTGPLGGPVPIKLVRASAATYRRIVRRWRTSEDGELQLEVAQAWLQWAACLLDLDDERAARRELTAVAAFASDPTRRDTPEMETVLILARDGLEILDLLARARIPGPSLRTDYLKAQRRADRCRWRRHPVAWLLAGVPRNQTGRLVRAARDRHRRTAAAVRAWACAGMPFVLVLRNFDLAESSHVIPRPNPLADAEPGDPEMPETYFTVLSGTDGAPLVSRLAQLAPAVQVASPRSADLGFGWHHHHQTTRFEHQLYLPDKGWLDTVRVLVSLAERVVVWAAERTPGLTEELDLLRESGRAADTVVLLEARREFSTVNMMYELVGAEWPTASPPLTPDDPVLASFPTVLNAADAAREADNDDSPFLHAVLEGIADALNTPTDQRVAQMRRRARTMGLG